MLTRTNIRVNINLEKGGNRMKKYLLDYKEVIIFYLSIIFGIIAMYLRFKYLNS